ncbi:mid region of cactin-domain-containing protein [Haematococcus lacustris]
MGSKREKKRKSKKSKRKKSSSSESTSQSSSSDSGDDRKRQKSEKLAQKVVAHLQKSSGKGPDQPFVWGKKVEKELAEGKKLKDISVFSDRNRLQERLEELEKVRKRQADRELEKARREEELGMVQRMRAAQEAMDSEAKEEEFYLQSLLSKAERRLREGRPAPSDLIARNLHAGLRLGEPADVDMKEPWSHFTGLQLDDVEALHDDIREYAEYDKHEPMHTDFWKALLAVADHELLEARKRDAVDRAHLAGGADAAARLAAASADGEKGLHPDVEADIQVMLQGQTYNELCSLEASLQASLASGEGDPEYWHAVLQRLQLHKAKAHVRDIQSRIVSATLQRLAQEAAEAAEELGLSASPDDSQGSYDGSSEDDDDDDDNDDDKEEVEGGGAGGKQQQSSGAAKVRPAGILGTAVGRAMGWAREDRQVVRAPELADAEPAAGVEEAARLANPEEIELDYGEGSEDGDKAGAGEQAQAQATTGEAGLSGDADAGPSGVATADEKKSKKKSKKSRRPRDAARDTAGAGQEGDGEGDDAAGALGPSMVGPQPANVVFPSEVPGFGRRRRRPRKGADNEAEDLARRVGGEVEEAEEAVADGTRSPEPVDPLSIVGQEVVHEEDDYR